MADSLSDNARAAMNRVIQQFKDGNLSQLVQVITIRRSKHDMPSANWSLSNQMLAFMQTMGATLDCRGFRQWEEVGRKVKKGAKAVYILGPVTRKIEDKATGDTKVIVVGFRSIPVFSIEDTEGDDLKTETYEPAVMPPLMDVAARLGVKVTWGPIGGNAYGWFSPKGEHIHLGTHEWGTFFHELAHAAHNDLEKLKGGQDVDQEVVAEFTAAVLMSLYGHDYTGNAWQYISAYASTDPLKAVVRCLSTIEKVVDLICGEEREVYLEKEEA